MTSKAKQTYIVTGQNESEIRLRRMGTMAALSAVTIRRDQIASVRQSLGYYHVETTGGHVYDVIQGMRKSRRDLTIEAFEQ